ncbi:MAG: alpha/beta fold hydrolase [Chloroflexi bacterium]|nr:alpha/beta fold hydrolase [Chloroflexota bacterium]
MVYTTHAVHSYTIHPEWLDTTLYPFTSRFINIDGNRLHYIDEGSGPVILFVHGTASWSFIYRDIIQNLRRDFRCIALDWPGFGLSEAAPDFEATLEGNSHLLEAFIRKLDLTNITVYGHDSAASMAMGVVGRHPEWFRAVSAANAFTFPLQGEFPSITRFLRVIRTPIFRFLITQFNFLQRYTNNGLRGGKLTRAEKAAYLGPTLDKSRRRHHHQMLATILDGHDYLVRLEQQLQAVREMPVLLTFGNTDEAYKAGFMQRWQQMFPNHRVFIVDGGTHFPQEDDPQGIAEAIRRWWHEDVVK